MLTFEDAVFTDPPRRGVGTSATSCVQAFCFSFGQNQRAAAFGMMRLSAGTPTEEQFVPTEFFNTLLVARQPFIILLGHRESTTVNAAI